MKPKRFNPLCILSLSTLGGLFLTLQATASPIYKENNDDDLNLGSSWEDGVPPGPLDVATWDSFVTGPTTTNLGAELSWSGMQIMNPLGPVTINGANTLTLGQDGIILSSTAPVTTLNVPVVLGENQTWSIAAGGGPLQVNGVISGSGILSKAGNGNLILGGDQSNTFTSPFVIDTSGPAPATSSVFFAKTNGAKAVPANSVITFGNTTVGQMNLRMMESDQFGAGTMINFVNPSGQWTRFDLLGTHQTLAGIQSGTPATGINGSGIVQNRELSGTANRGLSVLTLNVNTSDPNYPVGGYHFNGHIRDADSGDNPANLIALVKNGNGVQALTGNQIGYEGGTTVNGGILDFPSGNGMDNARGGWTINSGGMIRAVAAHNVYGGINLNGGELAGSGAPLATYGHIVLQGNVSVGGTSTSKISADMRIGSNTDRVFNVAVTGDPSGIDLDFVTGDTSTGRLGHLNGVTNGYMTKTGPGTLRFNNPGDIGHITNNEGKIIFNESFVGNGGLTNNAEVEIINSTDVIFGNPILGGGNIVKSGVGMLTLTSTASNFTGSFEIAGGDLTIGNASGTLNWSGDISGTGSLTKSGGGTLVLTGALSHTGGTSVTGGILSVPGAFNEDLSVIGSTAGFVGGDSLNSLLLDGANYYSSGMPLAITGDLSLTGDNWVYLASPPALGTGDILLMTYGGALVGNASNLSFPEAANYRGSPGFTVGGGEVKLSGLEFKSLTWVGSGEGGGNLWDILTTANWDDGSGPDTFAFGDAVVFNDSGVVKTVTIPASVSPSAITFNNSVGNDYTVSGSPIIGNLTVTKDGTGTATLGGANTFVGTTAVNGGIFRPSGNQAFGANGNPITVAAGATLNTNGAMNANRDYHAFIAGTGTAGSGAIINTGAAHNNGFGAITLTGNASIGGTARWDLRPAIGNGALLALGSHTLTKTGANLVALVEATITGAGTINIDTGTLSMTRCFANDGGMINVASGATLFFENNTTGTGIYTQSLNVNNGTVNLSGGDISLAAPVTTTDNASFNTGSTLTLSGVVSGNGNITKTAGGALQFLGAQSNTFTGDYLLHTNGGGTTFLGKTGGAVAIPAGTTIEFGVTTLTGQANLRMLADNQFGAGVRINFNTPWNQWSRFDLMGTDQSIAGLSTGSPAVAGGAVVQNRETGNSTSLRGTSVLTLTGNVGDSGYPVGGYYFNGHLRDSDTTAIDPNNKLEVVKNGTGTQTLTTSPGQTSRISFSGDLTVNAGRLIGSGARFNQAPGNMGGFGAGLSTRTITVNSGGILDFGVANMWGNHNHTNVPTLVINGGTVTNSDPTEPDGKVNNALNNVVLNNGTLTSTTGNSLSVISESRPGEIYGAWNLNGSVTSSGASTISASTPAGVVMLGSAGNNTVFNVTGGTLTVSTPLQDGDSGTLANLVKDGAGTMVLSATNVYTTNTIVNEGSLVLAETGSMRFKVTNSGNNQITGTGSVTLNGAFAIDTAAVTEETGSWTLVDTAALGNPFGGTFSIPGWNHDAGQWTLTEGAKTWTFTQTTGVLELNTDTASFASWIASFGLMDGDAAAGFDADNDGIANAVEMVLGGDPADGMDAALMPTLELVTDPDGMPAGDYLLFTYRRTDLSVAAGVAATAQYGATLANPWLGATHGVDGVVILEDDDYAWSNPPAVDPTDRVRVYIPRTGNTELFGRLQVTVP